MPNELMVPAPTLIAFLLVLARVAGVVAFVPIPGLRNGPLTARVVLVLALAMMLLPSAPVPSGHLPAIGELLVWSASEAAFGLTIGLALSFWLEGFQLAGQAIGLQAGYSYASTIDPNTQADSSVLVLMAQLLAGLLFFSLGFEREITKILAKSLVRFPPGSYKIDGPIALAVVSLGKEIFREGLRLALPVIALLLLIDLALGMLSRVQTQLQLLTLAFPVKMLVAILVLTSSLVLFPSVFARSSSHVLSTLLRLASH